MDPVLAGVLSNIAYKSLSKAVSLPFQSDIEKRMRNAAEKVAHNHDPIEPDDLLQLLYSDEVDESVKDIKSGNTPSREDLTAALSANPVTTYTEADAQVIVDEFLEAIELELTTEPILWRRLILQYIKEQSTDVEKLEKSLESTEVHEIADTPTENIFEGLSGNQTGYDAFICHASEDKDDFVRPLANELSDKGVEVWYDEFELEIGDSIRQSIDKGLSRSSFGIVVLSDHFFQKKWTQYELNALMAMEMNSHKVILPVWYDISEQMILNHSPALADKLALRTNEYNNVKEISQELYEVMQSKG